MSQCPNCKAKLSCGCQKRVASNGAAVCSMCITAYENMLKQGHSRPVPIIPKKAEAPVNPNDVNIVITEVKFQPSK